jgi:sensor histidine kinase regulating citrate/malate metabolism
MRLKRFRDWSIRTKILGLSLSGTVFMCLVVALYFLPTIEVKMLDERKIGIRESVDIA